jgi:hypothetical protein
MRRIWMGLIVLLLGCCVATSGVRSEQARPAIHENTPDDFLKDEGYTDLVIEITPAQGAVIDQDAVAFLVSRVTTYCHKDQVFAIINPPVKIDPLDNPFAFQMMWLPIWDDTSTLAFERNFKLHSSKHLLVLHIAYLNRSYVPMPDGYIRLAEAFQSRYIAMFRESFGQQDEILLHEFGHIMGLTGPGSHQDSEHGSHCSNRECLMYWLARPREPGAPIEFDANCLQDIAKAGGKKHYW